MSDQCINEPLSSVAGCWPKRCLCKIILYRILYQVNKMCVCVCVGGGGG